MVPVKELIPGDHRKIGFYADWNWQHFTVWNLSRLFNVPKPIWESRGSSPNSVGIAPCNVFLPVSGATKKAKTG
jgi:hypothetical protein